MQPAFVHLAPGERERGPGDTDGGRGETDDAGEGVVERWTIGRNITRPRCGLGSGWDGFSKHGMQRS